MNLPVGSRAAAKAKPATNISLPYNVEFGNVFDDAGQDISSAAAYFKKGFKIWAVRLNCPLNQLISGSEPEI